MILIASFLFAIAIELWACTPQGRLGTYSQHPVHSPAPTKLAKIMIFGVGGVLILVTAREHITTALAGLLAGIVAWKIIASHLRANKDKQRTRVLAQFLGLVTAELSAGAEVGSAITSAAEEIADEEISTAMAVAGRTTRAGRSGAQALHWHSKKIPQLKPLAAVWAVSETYGISLTELLANAQQRIDSAHRRASATAASLQGAKATATILSLLPLLGIGMGYAMGVDTVGFLLGGGIGGLLLVVGVGLLCAGIVLSHKIIVAAA